MPEYQNDSNYIPYIKPTCLHLNVILINWCVEKKTSIGHDNINATQCYFLLYGFS